MPKEARMDPKEVLAGLRANGVTQLHHANTVTTSCTLLEQGGLASRGFVADRKLEQTPQYTDKVDQQYGIWHDVFVDSVDIHERARIRNQYGPVLFVLPIDILKHLPAGTIARVTRANPTKWSVGEPDAKRYFLTRGELDEGFVKGDFDQMLVIRTKEGIVRFPESVQIVLDDPQRTLKNGTDIYARAKDRLIESAAAGGVNISIAKRKCRDGCGCLETTSKGKPQYGSFPDLGPWFK